MPSAQRRILVTGVAGFIGSNLACRLLDEGYEVVGVDDLSQGVLEQVPDGVEFHELDVRSPALATCVRGVDAVFHLAAKNCISDCEVEPVAAASTNIVGTVNLLEVARACGVRRLVLAESSAVYEGVDRFPTPEDETAPRSIYALTKQAGAEFAHAYARNHALRLTALRYFCVYGPRQDYRRTVPPVMSAFILALLQGRRPVIYGTGERRRDFVYVDDINDFHMQCLTDERTHGGTFNLGSGTDHSVREIYDLIRELVGSDVEPEYRAALPGEAERTCGDITRARALGWQPRVPLRDGLQRSVEYLREHVLPQLAVTA